MADIDIRIHDIIVSSEFIIFVETDGSRTKLAMNQQERELLKERLDEYSMRRSKDE